MIELNSFSLNYTVCIFFETSFLLRGTMKIKKILNNNTAVIDDNGNEVIVIGKGICFQHKVGDSINSALVEKQFFLSSNDLNLNLQKVLVSLPLSEINIVDLSLIHI